MTARQEQRLYTRVLQILAQWLKRVLDAVLRAYRSFGLPPDPNGVFEADPYWEREVAALVEFDLEEIAEEGWETVAKQLGLDIPFISTDSFIQAQFAITQNLLVRIPDEVYSLIFAEINDGVNNGDDPDQLAARIENVLSMTGSENWPERARVIAVTEANRANNAGAFAAGLQSERIEGISLHKKWLATEDGRTRPTHRHADGQVRPLSQPFQVGEAALMYPGDPSGPPHEVIFCVPGTALITDRAEFTKGYRYRYTGNLLTLRSAEGVVATVSPDHPVLTVRGWLPAGEVNEGDYLIGTPLRNRLSGAQPDEQVEPPTAEKIFDSLSGRNRANVNRVDHLSVNFHGYGPDSDVDVVTSDRELDLWNDGFIPPAGHEFYEFSFACADAPTAGGSHAFRRSLRSRSSRRNVSFADLLSALLFIHPEPLDLLRLASATGLGAAFKKATTDDTSTNIKVFGDRVLRLARMVALHHISNIEIVTVQDEYLYTFETSTGIYVADHIVTHNCRCALLIED